ERLYSLNIFQRIRSLHSQRTELSLPVTASSSGFGTEKRPNPPSDRLGRLFSSRFPASKRILSLPLSSRLMLKSI
ncbi:hypothetical protein Prudu_006873, partial [Prunus dulcis]